jgi:Flp pilus assembly pilin Flp
MKLLSKLLKDNKGAATTEYALLLALIAMVALAAIFLLGEGLTRPFMTVADALHGTESSGASLPPGSHDRPQLH